MPEDRRKPPDASQFSVVRGEPVSNQAELGKLAPHLERLTSQIARILRDNPVVAVAFIGITADNGVEGTVMLERDNPTGKVSIRLEGYLQQKEAGHTGTPFLAPTDGTFYRQSRPGQKPYVGDGDTIEPGQRVAWWVVNKNTAYGLTTPEGGKIVFAAKNAAPVKASAPLWYIQPSSK